MNLFARFSLALTVIAAVYAPVAVQAAPQQFVSSEKQTTVIELYTSQGCSSCPPAEAWLSRWLDKPELWQSVIPLAFHVSYWNYLGWPDVFADQAYDQRQKRYQTLGYSRSTYTPEFIVNGREWRGWFLRQSLPVSEKTVGVMSASLDGNQFDVQFKPVAALSGEWVLHAALLGQNRETEIKAGENHGKRLKHDFIVLEMINGGSYSAASADGYRWQGALPNAALDSTDKDLAVAFWLTDGANPTPVQAVAGAIR